MSAESRVIFVVDDEPMIADLVEHSLAQHGFNAFKFYDPLKALDSCDSISPNLLLSDFRMPGMDGLTLAAKIRERYPDCVVLIMSGYAHEANSHPQRGTCELLSKPVSLSKLLAKVTHLLENSNAGPRTAALHMDQRS